MSAIYTEKDLIDFGNYVLSDQRKEFFTPKETRKPIDTSERLKEVHDADLDFYLNNIKPSKTDGKD